MKTRIAFFLAVIFASASILLATPLHAATINVTTTLDEFSDVGGEGCAPPTGACSLREAIEVTNRQDGVNFGGCPGTTDSDNVIVLQNLTYTLTCQGSDEDDNASGDLDIHTNVRIEGVPGETVVDASGLKPVTAGKKTPDRVFHIVPPYSCAACSVGLVDTLGEEPFATVTLFGMRITGGDVFNNYYCNGGGILNHGNLTVEQVEVTGNLACNGGGIANELFLDIWSDSAGAEVGAAGSFEGQLTVLQSQIHDNQAFFSGGGIASGTQALTVSIDAALIPPAFVTIRDSLIQGNEAFFGEGGGGIYLFFSFLDMDQTTVDSNQAGNRGGGIAGNWTCMYCLTEASEVQSSGLDGLLWTFISNSTVSRNQLVAPEEGENAQGFDSFGGGVAYTGGTHVLSNSTLSNNTAFNRGGGLYYERPNVLDLAGAGGPFELRNFVTLYNLTIAENTVTNPPAGPTAAGIIGAGGGIYESPFCALPLGGGDGDGDGDCMLPPPAITILDTLIAKNQAGIGPDCYSGLLSAGYNLIGDVTDCVVGDAPAVAGAGEVVAQAQGDQFGGDGNPVIDPKIGPLQYNGGPNGLETHALAPDSPAVDTGNDVEGCLALDIDSWTEQVLDRDERDSARPVPVKNPNEPICDIGAFELLVFDFSVSKVNNLAGDAELGQPFAWTITVTNTGVNPAPNVVLTDPLPLGCDVFGVIFQSVQTDHGSCSESGGTVSCNLGTLIPGESAVVTIQVEACGPEADGNFHAIENTVSVTAGDQDFLGFLTKTAQNDVTLQGDLVFGDGCGFSLMESNGVAAPGTRTVYAIVGLLLFTALMAWRRELRRKLKH